jgi:hypothetical protein
VVDQRIAAVVLQEQPEPEAPREALVAWELFLEMRHLAQMVSRALSQVKHVSSVAVVAVAVGQAMEQG